MHVMISIEHGINASKVNVTSVQLPNKSMSPMYRILCAGAGQSDVSLF